MTFKKEFISGAELRKRWNIDKKQLFDIIHTASLKIEKNGKWLLRPYNPRNYKEVVYSEGNTWPPCRENHGKIIDNYTPPEYDSNFKNSIEFLDQYLFLIKDVEIIKQNFLELTNNTDLTKTETYNNISPSEMGQKGGKASKIKKPILQAISEFLTEKPKRMEQSTEEICSNFLKAYKGKDKGKEVKIDNQDYDVFYDNKKIYYKLFNDRNTSEKSITLNTFKNTYIPRAKKEIQSKI